MKNKIATQFRQGDVLIERVDKIPTGGKDLREGKRVILAHGEVTGHAHEIEEADTARIFSPETPFQTANDLTDSLAMTRAALKLGRDSTLKHQEHARIELPKGNYRVTRQREYSPEAIRNVAD